MMYLQIEMTDVDQVFDCLLIIMIFIIAYVIFMSIVTLVSILIAEKRQQIAEQDHLLNWIKIGVILLWEKSGKT